MPGSVDDLPNHDCLTFARGGYVLPWTVLDDAGRALDIRMKGRHIISDGDALRAAALDGLGIGQFPTWLVADALRDGSLISALLPEGIPGSPIQALWPATRDLAPRIRATVDGLLQAFTPLAPWDSDLPWLQNDKPL